MGWLKKVGKALEKANKQAIRYGTGVGLVEDVGQWVKDARDHNQHVADRQNKQAMEAWQMQNEYNTPANQIQRLIDAGLNPNLAYSNVDTGNAKSAPDITNVGDKGALLEGVLGHAFSAVQLFSSLQSAKAQQVAMLEQAQHQKDVLQFQKDQAAVQNAFREAEILFRKGASAKEAERWQQEFDERVRHNKAMENKSLESLLTNLLGRFIDYNVDDVPTSAGRFMRKSIASTIDPKMLSLNAGVDVGKAYMDLLYPGRR